MTCDLIEQYGLDVSHVAFSTEEQWIVCKYDRHTPPFIFHSASGPTLQKAVERCVEKINAG